MIKINAPILAITHIIIAIFLGLLLPLPFPSSNLVQWLGLGLSIFGFILGALALREFRHVRISPNLKKNASTLVMSGIYRYTRNPVYLGFVFMLIGLPLNMGNYWGIVLVLPLITFINNLVIKQEEKHLEYRYKDEYTSYKSRVRRWL
jgi:protein-S-isoprenylcysteine O-methyltransferase Ste14